MDEISYARADDHHIAYRVTAGATAGGVDVVMVAGAMFPFEMLAEDRVASRFMAGLAALGRLVVFDKRGVGLSDPMTDWSRSAQEQWAEDLCAVVEAAELEHPAVVSWDGMGVARLAVSKCADLFGSMVLINPFRSTKGMADFLESHGDDGVSGRSIEEKVFPSRANDPDFWDWMARAGRSGASPASAGRIWGHMLSCRAPLTPAGMQVRAMVLRNRDSMEIAGSARAVADEIPGAIFVEVPGADVYPSERSRRQRSRSGRRWPCETWRSEQGSMSVTSTFAATTCPASRSMSRRGSWGSPVRVTRSSRTPSVRPRWARVFASNRSVGRS